MNSQNSISNYQLLLAMFKPLSFILILAILISNHYGFLSTIGQIEKAEAAYTINDSDGYFQVDFNGSPQGVAPAGPLRDGINIDGVVGNAQLMTGSTTGYFATVEVTPNSFSLWKELKIDGNYSAASDVQARVLDCSASPVPVAGPLGSYQNFVGGKLDISSLSTSTYSCIRAQVKLTKSGAISPVINDFKITWSPLPVLLTQHTIAATTSPVGGEINYQVKYSVSYSRDNGVVAWVPIPNNTTNPGSIIYPSTYPATTSATSSTSLYSQDATPVFVSADTGGQFTSTSITVGGITIPANSVYWNLGTQQAGTTGNLGFKIKSPNGIQNGVQYITQSHIDSAQALEKVSDSNKAATGTQPLMITLTSAAGPTINKHVLIDNAYKMGTDWRIISTSPVITYHVGYGNFANLYNQPVSTVTDKGEEVMFNTVVTDDVTDILNKLQSASCGSLSLASAQARVSSISAGGALSGNIITWNIGDLNVGSTTDTTFSVDYAGCADNTSINNVANIKADNTATVTDQVTVKIGIDLTPVGTFAKGDTIYGKTCINYGKDDNQCDLSNVPVLQMWGEDGEYNMIAVNTGASRIDDIYIFDKIPEGQTFVSAGSADPSVKVFYNTDGALNASDTPPVYSTSTMPGALGGTWTDTVPATATDVMWVAYYSPSIASAVFPTDPGSVNASATSFFIANLNTNITSSSTADQCSVYDQSNTAVFEAYKVSNDLANADGNMVDMITKMSAVDTELTHVSNKKIGKLEVSSSDVTLASTTVEAPGSQTMTITIRNTGQDASLNTVVTLPIPTANINGVLTPLDFISASGGTVTTTGAPVDTVTVNVGTLNSDASKTITLNLSIPSGIQNGEVVNGNVVVTGSDDASCEDLKAAASYNFDIHSVPNVQIYKTRDESVIPPKGDIHYQIHYNNLGSAPTHNQYIIDRIPLNTVFKYAYTGGTDDNNNAYDCGGCKAYFSTSLSALPPGVTPMEVFDLSYITANFTLGTEVSTGKWTSPFGSGTLWVAFLSDDTGLANPNFSTTRLGDVGITVSNDLDGAGPGTDGSPAGDVIANESAVFADEVLQAISNQVLTTILPDAGLLVDKYSATDYVSAGETFNWYINYRNDTGNDTDYATITDTLPAGVSLKGVYNTWSNYTASSSTSTPPLGEQNITANPCVVTTVNPDLTTTININIATCLRGDVLFKNEGGRLRISAEASSTLLTGAVLLNKADGLYKNASSGPFLIHDEDPVFVVNPDLWIRKQVSIQEPVAGETLDYTLTISNEGKHFASGTIITDTLPIGLCYIPGTTSITPSGYTLSEPTVTGGPCNSAPTTLTWNDIHATGLPVGQIPAQSPDIFLRYKVQVDPSVAAGTTLTNGAGVTNTLPEDPVYSNGDSKSVIVPYPDVYVTKSAQATVVGGGNFEYTITYGNASRQAASNVYIVDTLPDTDVNGESDVTLISVTATGTKYYNSAVGAAPAFNPLSPISNGWGIAPASSTNHIAVLYGNMTGNDGPYTVRIKVSARDPGTNIKLSAGTKIVNNVIASTTDFEATTTNNLAAATTTVPAFDLTISKTGSIEGAYPGATPGAPLSYTIVVSNKSTQPACSVYFTDTLPTGYDYTSISPMSATLKDELGNNTKFETPLGSPINTPVPLSISLSGSTYRYELGTPHTNVCMPANSSATFTINGKVSASVLDGYTLNNTAHVGEDSAGIEDTVSNNDATSTVVVWRADVMTTKDGKSCGADQICGNADDSTTNANIGDLLRYTIGYNNIGNANASNTVLEEMVPIGTCFKTSSIAPIPAGATVEYSNDSGSTWGYTPTGSTDCNVTNFRMKWDVIMAPPNVLGKDTQSEWLSSFITSATNTSLGGSLYISTSTAQYISEFAGSGTGVNDLYSDPVVINDLNGDTLADFILPISQAGGSRVCLTSATAPYLNCSLIPSSASSITSASNLLADLNSDGLQDFVLTADGGATAAQTCISSAAAPYFTCTNITGAFGTSKSGSTFVPDRNADGREDFILASSGGQSKFCTSQASSPYFSCSVITGSGNSNYSPVQLVPDKNSDGIQDFILTQSGGLSQVCLSQAGAPYYNCNNIASSFANNYSKIALINDVNSDGKQDFVLGSRYGNTEICTSIASSPYFTCAKADGGNATYSQADNNSEPTILNDINSDGRQDFVLGSGFGSGSELCVSKLAAPYFTCTIMTGANNRNYSAISLLNDDLNSDGKIDLIVPSAFSATQVCLSTLTSPYYSCVDLIGGSISNTSAALFSVYDISMDGLEDFILGSNAGDNRICISQATSPYFTCQQLDGSEALNGANVNPISLFNDFNGDSIYEILIPGNSGTTQVCESKLTAPYFQCNYDKVEPSAVYSFVVTPATSSITWDKMLTAYKDTASSSVVYTLCKSNFTGPSSTCLPADLIYSGDAADGYVNISTVPSNQSIYVKLSMYSDGNAANNVIIDKVLFSYRGDVPTFNWDAIATSTPSPILSINNVVNIQTDTPEITTTNNTDTKTLQIEQSDLEVIKSVDKASAQVGDQVTYTLNYKNNGPTTAKSVKIVDTLPPGFVYVSASSTTSGVTCSDSAGVLTCTKPNWDMAVNDSGVITIVGNIAAISNVCSTYNLPNTTTGSAVVAPPPYQTLIPVSVTGVGTVTSATISYTSVGPYGWYYSATALISPSSTTTLSNLYVYTPETYVGTPLNYSSTTSAFNGESANGTWYLAYHSMYAPTDLTNAKLEVCYDAAMQPDTNIINNVNITSSTTDIQPANNTSAAYTVVGTYANNYIRKSGPTRANVDKDITYTIEYGNNGASVSLDDQIIDTYNPAQMTFVSASNTGAVAIICGSTVAGILECDTNGATAGGQFSLPAGATGTISITMHVVNDFNLLVTNALITNHVDINTSSTETTVIDNADDHDVPVWPIGYSSLSGYVFIDHNSDVNKNGSDTAISGVVVSLSGTDIYGHVIAATTTTDGNGFYSFQSLAPGTYVVTETQPVQYISTGSKGGYVPLIGATSTGSVQGGPNPNRVSNIVLGEAQNSIQNNFGEVAGEIGNQVWDDLDGDGVFNGAEVGIPGVPVYAYLDANNNGVVDLGETAYLQYTNASGTYLFTDLPIAKYIILVDSLSPVFSVSGYVPTVLGTPNANNNNQNSSGYIINLTAGNPTDYTADFGYKATILSIGNTVWYDSNANGYQDIGEQGIMGVQVDLYDATGTLIISTTTNAAGNYLFDGLTASATYTVKVATATLPVWINSDTYLSATSTTGDGFAKDVSGYTVFLTSSNLTADFGFVTLGSLGDTVWFDRNLDGHRDATTSEPGLSNVQVNLYNASNTLIATTTTDSNGNYVFNNLPVNFTYTVSVSTSTLPVWAYIVTGTATTTDNSTNDYGHGTSATTYLSTSTTQNLNFDFSFSATGTIGNQLFIDNNLNGTYNSGVDTNIAAWLVSLFVDTDNNGLLSTSTGDYLYATTTTDSFGNYIFTNLPLVSYIVKVTNSITGYFTQIFGTNVGSDNNAQSNDYAITLSTSTQSNTTADFGYYVMPDLQIVKSAATASPIYINSTTSFSIVVSVNKDFGAASNTITVSDTLPSGLSYVSAVGTNWTCNSTILCTYNGTYPVTASTTLPTITVVAQAIATGTYTNTAIVDMASTTDMHEATTTNNTSSAGVEIWPEGQIGNQVFFDQNNDGVFNGADFGLANVTIELRNASNTLIATTTTDSNGNYIFHNVALNQSYTVNVLGSTVPSWINNSTHVIAGVTTTDSYAKDTSGYSVHVSTTTPTNYTADFGYTALGSIGDQVFFDQNNDGVFNGVDSTIPSALVTLTNNLGSVIATTTTSATGTYLFSGLSLNTSTGTYYVVTVATGTLPTGLNLNTLGAVNTNDNSQTNGSQYVLSTSTQNIAYADFGFTARGEIGNHVFFDRNNDGLYSGTTTEPGLSNVQVNLYNASNTLIATTTTDGNGNYMFTNLDVDATYTAKVATSTLPAWATTSTGQISTTDESAKIDTGYDVYLSAATNTNYTADFGYTALGSIGNQVFLDTNHDGVYSTTTESGIAGVIVELYNAITSALVGTTTTSATGTYSFTDLPLIGYVVKIVTITLPAWATNWFAGLTTVDYNSQDYTGYTVNLSTSTPANTTADFGFADSYDLGITKTDNKTLYMSDTGAQTNVYTIVVTNYSLATVTNATITDAMPIGISSQTWMCEVSAGDLCSAGAGTGSISSLVTLGAGHSATITATATVQAGYVDPITNVASVSLPSIYFQSTTTNNSDIATDTDTVTLASLGDKVWSDDNNNGIQDAGEAGVPNVIVTLYSSSSAVLATTTTSATGTYLFDNLIPATYIVGFSNLPATTTLSTQNVGASTTIDSNPSVLTGFSAPVSIVSGEHNTSIDAGIVTLGSLGDTVWFDRNLDGHRDATTTEPGLSNVQVNLYNASNTLIATTTTDSNGSYVFNNLPVNFTYTVSVSTSTLPVWAYIATVGTMASANDYSHNPSYNITLTSITRENYTGDFGFSATGTVGNQLYFDLDANGKYDAGETVPVGAVVGLYNTSDVLLATTTTNASGVYLFKDIPLTDYMIKVISGVAGSAYFPIATTTDGYGKDPLGYVLSISTSSVSNYTADFGYLQGKIGNTVYVDENRDGQYTASDTPITNVIIELYNPLGVLIATTTTSATGTYLFENLPPMAYTVKVLRSSISNPDYSGIVSGLMADDQGKNPTGYTVTLTPSYTEDYTADFGYNTILVGSWGGYSTSTGATTTVPVVIVTPTSTNPLPAATNTPIATNTPNNTNSSSTATNTPTAIGGAVKKLKKRLAKTGFDITYTAELAGLLVIVLVAVIVFTRKRREDK